MELSIEQQLAIDKFREGHNIFLTGPGGTGKTEIIKNIKQIAEDNNTDWVVKEFPLNTPIYLILRFGSL
jgi:ABC-type ATPase involved in cell division